MRCPKCQFDNPKWTNYCGDCGAKLEKLCPNCHSPNPPKFKFCGECGGKLESSIEFSDTAKESADPPPQPTGKIKSDDAAPIVSERKHVTVLFSDLTGYTAMSEKLDPEEVKAITAGIFSELTKIIEKYDGFIEKYVGDAILAVFGAVTAFEDSALRAIKAAREIHAHVLSISPKYEDLIGRPLNMHTGINSGLVVTGDVNFQKGTHGLVGDTINTAARLMSISKAEEIIVDRDSFIQTQGYFEFETLEPVKMKGKADLIQAYRVGKALKAPKKLHRLYGRRAELIGRSIEMQVLEDAAERLEKGEASVIAVCGTAGTGKSRLVHDFRRTLNLQHIQWFDANAYPHTQNSPYYPLIDLLTKAFGIEEGDRAEAIKRKVENGLRGLLGRDSKWIPYVGGLFSIEYPEISEVSPEFWKDQLFSAVADIVKALINSGPFVICMEDMHWADPSFMELVRKLFADIGGPLLLICIYRPTISIFTDFEIQALNVHFKELRLRELSPSETQSMVSSLLSTERIPKELRSFIHDNVEGNPFFVEEMINTLIETEALSNNSGVWELKRKIDDSGISTNIQGVIAGRIDRLGRDTKRILQEASVIGRAFLFDILQRISEIKEDIDKNLVLLERLDLISAKSIQPTLEYIFKHALTQEIVYSGLVKSERTMIHEKIGNVIEILFHDRISEVYETLAYHYELGTSKFKAVEYLVKSGEKSLKRFSLDEAHKYFRKGFDLLSENDSMSNADCEALVNLINKWGMVFYYRGTFSELEALLSNHDKIAKTIDDQEQIGMFFAWRGLAAWIRGELLDSYKYLEYAKKIGKNSENKIVYAYALTWISWLCADMGLFAQGIKDGATANEIAQDLDSEHYLFFKSLAGIGYNHYCSGNVTELLRIGKQLIEYGKRYSHVRCLVMGYMLTGSGQLNAGDFSSAIELCEKGYHVAKDPFYKQGSLAYLLIAYLADRQISKVEKYIDDLISYCDLNGNEFTGGPARMIAAIHTIDSGKFSKGMNLLEYSRNRCHVCHRKGIIPVVDLTIGNLFLEITKGEQTVSVVSVLKNIGFVLKNAIFSGKRAEEYFSKAIKSAEKIGAVGIQGQAYLGLGSLCRVQKKYHLAESYLTRSIDIFGEINAIVFLEQANNELKKLPQKSN